MVRSHALYPTELLAHMTERVGFEPTMQFDPHTPLAGERLQPLGHLTTQRLFRVLRVTR